MAFCLVSFHDPETREPLCACPRGLLKTTCDKLAAKEIGAMAGGQSLRAGEPPREMCR